MSFSHHILHSSSSYPLVCTALVDVLLRGREGQQVRDGGAAEREGVQQFFLTSASAGFPLMLPVFLTRLCPAAKKTETPKLWMRLAEQWGGSCVFGEIRLSEQGLMDKHGIKEEDLPRVVAFFATEGGGELGHRPLSYEGTFRMYALNNCYNKHAMRCVLGVTFRFLRQFECVLIMRTRIYLHMLTHIQTYFS